MLGIETFKRGLNRYLSTKYDYYRKNIIFSGTEFCIGWLIFPSAYGNAQQDDLWQAMQEQADEEGIVLPATVKEILDTWTYKMGYPVVTVTRDYATGGALVTQVYDDTISHILCLLCSL
jgi:aminopeptidase N